MKLSRKVQIISFSPGLCRIEINSQISINVSNNNWLLILFSLSGFIAWEVISFIKLLHFIFHPLRVDGSFFLGALGLGLVDLLRDLVWVALGPLLAAGEVRAIVVLFFVDLFYHLVSIIGLWLSVLEKSVVNRDGWVRISTRDLLLNFRDFVKLLRRTIHLAIRRALVLACCCFKGLLSGLSTIHQAINSWIRVRIFISYMVLSWELVILSIPNSTLTLNVFSSFNINFILGQVLWISFH